MYDLLDVTNGNRFCVLGDKGMIIASNCQSTGVAMLHKLLIYINRLRKERNVPMYPWVVDTHDQSTWEVKDEYVEEAKEVFKEAYRLLNEELQPTIKLKGDIETGQTYWEFKKN